MIPAEIATRLKLLVSDELRNIAPLRELPSDLPEFSQGQRFAARILNPLPDGTWRALVAGRSMTLALPGGAQSGDVLELEVTGRAGETIAARQVAPESAQSPASSTRISATGQLISQLLTGRGGGERATPLQNGQPLLPHPTASAAQLLPALRQAIAQSGLFYESHLAQWAEGSLPLEELIREPQARQTPHRGEPQPAGSGPAATRPGSPADAATATRPPGPDDTVAEESLPRTALPRLAEPLMPLVHQQLESLAAQNAVWQGIAWPGQPFFLEIEPPPQHASGEGEGAGENSEEAVWQSSLRLTMPWMGETSAQLVITAAGVGLRLTASHEQAAADLEAARERLATALDAAGVPLTGFVVTLRANHANG